MNADIKLSIALVTRNRPKRLERTLQSICKQSYCPYEVLISDDSSDEQFQQANQNLALKYNYKYIKGPKRGLYANRNFVAKACTGTHIRTVDDDHEFPDDHFAACIRAIVCETDTVWTIGEYSGNSKVIPEMPYPVAGQVHAKGYSFPPKSSNDQNYYGISCGATIYPIGIINKGILNEECYKFGILYLEYGLKLKYFGYTLKPLKTTYVIHNDIQTTASEINRQIITEARIFVILCMSFFYRPSMSNKILTSMEILKCMLGGQVSFSNVRNAFKNLKKTKNNVIKIKLSN